MNRLTDCFFVHLGACTGNHPKDYLYHNIVDLQWRGIVVEPVPHLFARLQNTYKECPGVICENSAISDSDGAREFFYIGEQHVASNLDTFVGSLDANHVKSHTNSPLSSMQVQCLTLRSLLAKHHVTRVDFLEIDLEGQDEVVIRQIPFDIITPQIIIYEHKHMAAPSDVETFLRDHGYDVKNTVLSMSHDTIAWRKDTDFRLLRFLG